MSEKLQKAHALAATLAASRGEDNPAFLELFMRVEALVEQERQKETTLDRARRLAAARIAA